jgi:hypothetical protein
VISPRATSRWLADPDTPLSELVAQAAAELRTAVAPSAPTVRRRREAPPCFDLKKAETGLDP